ncbi:MAG: alpha-amylase family protein [Actinomycetales bacterium]
MSHDDQTSAAGQVAPAGPDPLTTEADAEESPGLTIVDEASDDLVPAVVPEPVRARIRAVIAELAPHLREQLNLRIQRWWGDLYSAIAEVYPDPAATAGRALLVAVQAYAARPHDLHTLDAMRALEPDWFEQPRMVGYACYAERFAEPGTGLVGVADKAEHLRRLGVTYLHLMPLLQPRPEPSDGGYAVADYRSVRSDLGTTEDLRALTRTLRESGISTCVDLVLNHVAREHEWAVAARAGDPHYRDYFYVYPDRAEPDRYEATLPEVFPDFAPGNFTWDEDLQGWVWTTFNDYQWDLAWANPDVFVEMAEVICFLANLGVEVLRLDAIAFIFKRVGTNCQNQPEVHAITQALRTITRIACPAVIFKAEAIVGPDDLAAYLGQGEHYGKVSDIAYHNSLMVHIWSMLASRDATMAARALARIPHVPASTTWITYVRCHDDIGWAIDDQDAGAVGLTGHGHRGFLSDFYSGNFADSFADGLVFQYNPLTGDRRISGTTASLAGLEEALGRADPDLVNLAVRRILLAYAIIMSFGGIPMIWSGDEIAALNDAAWADEPAHALDNRWAHRPRIDWAEVSAVEHPEATPSPQQRVWDGLRRLVHIRGGLPLLHSRYASEPVECSDPGVFAVVQRQPAGVFLALHNVTEQARWVPAHWIREQGLEPTAMQDNLAIGEIRTDEGVTLGAYQSMWLTALPT